MKEAVVFLDMYRIHLEKDVFPFSVVAEDQRCGLSKEELESALPEFFEDFKATDIQKIRYVIVSAPGDSKASPFPELMKTIYDLHKRIILLPFEAEAFLLLPSARAQSKEKARCFEFFKILQKTNPEEQPDLIWLIDTDRLSPALFPEVLLSYLSTDAYRSFNGRLLLTKHGPKVTCICGSMGLHRIVFNAGAWNRYLSLMLARDILNTPPLSPFAMRLETAAMAFSQVSPFLVANLESLAGELHKPVTFSQAANFLEGVLRDEIQDPTELLGRLEIMIQQETARRWEAALQKAQEFTQQVKDECIQVLDHAPHGPYSAWGSIGLLMQSSGPYVEFFKALKEWPLDLKTTSLQGYLFGWREREPSPVLNLLFREITGDLCQVYAKRVLLFPSLQTWPALLQELDRLFAVKDIQGILAEDMAYTEDLREQVEGVVNNGINPFARPFDTTDLRSLISLIEHHDRKAIVDAMEAMAAIRQEIRDVEEEFQALKWWKMAFLFWQHLLRQRELKANLQNAEENLKEAYLRVVERLKRLFPANFSAYMVEELFGLLEPLEMKISQFCIHLQDTIDALNQSIETGKPVAPPLSFSALETEKEISRLYHKDIQPEHLPALFPEFMQVFKTKNIPQPKLSDFYASSEKRQMFNEGLMAYAAGKFSWILDWDAAKVITFLNKGERAGRDLAVKAAPFLRTRTDASEGIHKGLFMGLCNSASSPFEAASFESSAPVYFSNQDREAITALTLYHGFAAASIEGWDDWKACAEAGDSKESS